MGLRRSDLIASVIGLTLGGLGLVASNTFGPQIRGALAFLPEFHMGQAAAAPPNGVRRTQAPTGIDIAQAPGLNQTVSLPDISRSSDGTKAVLASGTGFFVSSDGSVLTAAHLVRECRGIRVVSSYLGMTTAELVAADPNSDLALLRTRRVRPPGQLGLAPPPSGSARLVVYGYPAGGDTQAPTEAPATMLSSHDPHQMQSLRYSVRLDASTVRQGYSGGPVLGPHGEVVGMIRAGVLGRSAGPAGRPAPTGVVIGPGVATIAAFLGRVAPTMEMVNQGAMRVSTATGEENARRAVVHVLCARQGRVPGRILPRLRSPNDIDSTPGRFFHPAGMMTQGATSRILPPV